VVSTAGKDEFALIDAIRRIAEEPRSSRPAKIGIGDDAALVSAATLVTTDAMVEGVHFRRDWLTPRALGKRALRAAVSDVAAMGGCASSVLVALTLPLGYASRDALALMRGFVAAAAEIDAQLVGGNISCGPVLSLTVTVLGQAAANTPARGNARVGDGLWVTGTLGGAAAAVKMLAKGHRRGALIKAYREPPLRLELAGVLARVRGVGAMIDLSDGLAQDLGHVCKASGVHAVIDTRLLPLSKALRRSEAEPLRFAVAGGEDYELLVSARPRAGARMQALAAEHGCMLTRIGAVRKRGNGSPVTDENGGSLDGGYRHF